LKNPDKYDILPNIEIPWKKKKVCSHGQYKFPNEVKYPGGQAIPELVMNKVSPGRSLV
jgi:hypothetical protein